MSAWGAALRIARREANRAKARSALIIAMIALPVMAMSFAAVTYDTFQMSPEDRAAREMGAAQSTLTWRTDGPITQGSAALHSYSAQSGDRVAHTDEQLLAQLPPGSTVLRDQRDYLDVPGLGAVNARAIDYENPLAAGILRPLEGRSPAAGDEIALNPAASDRLGTGIGGTVRSADGSRVFRVTGIVENPRSLDVPLIITHSATPSPDSVWMTETLLTSDQTSVLNAKGISVVTRPAVLNPPPGSGGTSVQMADLAIGIVIAGVAVLQIVLLAGSALAVGVRRRNRDMALVAAAGGTPRHIRRIVLADGIVHGVLAAALGVVLGVGTAAALVPVLENDLFSQRAGDLRLWPEVLAGLAGFAVVAGLLAAIVPAWITSRQDVVATLTGRRGIVRTRKRWPITGLLLAAAGAGLCVFGALEVDLRIVLFGLFVAAAGMVVCTPALIGLIARIGRWLPVSARIALRDTARNRTAAAPAISAVMAAVIATLVIGVVNGSQRAHDQAESSMAAGDVFLSPNGRDGFVNEAAVATARSILPVNQVYQVDEPTCDTPCFLEANPPPDKTCPYAGASYVTVHQQRAALTDPRCAHAKAQAQYFGTRTVTGAGASMTVVISAEAVHAVGIPTSDAPAVIAALRAGKVVVDRPNLVANDRIALTVSSPSGTRDIVAPGFMTPNPGRVPLVMMTKDTATSLGLKTRQVGVLATTTRIPTTEETDRLTAALGPTVHPYIQRDTPDNTTMTLLAIAAGVITLGASAIATGLAAADRRADVSTLAAVGASPWVRRKLALGQSGMIAGLGSLLGAVLGIGAAVAVLGAFNQGLASTWPIPAPYPIVVPWVNVAIAVLAVPVIAMLGAGLFTRSRLPIERRL